MVKLKFSINNMVCKKAMLLVGIAFLFFFCHSHGQTFSKRASDDLLSVYLSVINQPFGYQTIGVRIDTNGSYHFNTIIRNFNFEGDEVETKQLYFTNKTYNPSRDNNARLNDSTTVTVMMDIEDDNDTIYSTVLWLTNEGDTLQTRRFSSPYFIESNIQTNLNLPTSIICSPDGQFIYFVSQIFHSSSQNNFLIKKLTAWGEEVWTYVNPLNNGYYCNAIEYYNEQIWFIRSSLTSNRIFGLNDTTGEVETNLLISPLSLEYITPFDMFMEEDNFVVTTLDGSDEGTLPIIYKCSSNGDEIFQTSPQEAQYDFAQRNDHLVKSPDGGYVSCSVKYDEQINPEDPNDPSSNNTSEKIWLWKVDSDGVFQWQRFYEYLSFDSGYFYLNNTANDMKATPDGGYIMAGEATASCLQWSECDDFTQQGWLLKVDGCGCLVPGCDEGCVVGVEELANSEARREWFLVGPNPARDMLNVYLRLTPALSGGEGVVLVVHDILGNLVGSFVLKHDDTTYMIDTTSLASGEYVVSLVSEGVVLQTEKVVIAK
jgi:hypothetical protein